MKKHIILDTNLLILLVVGLTDKRYILRHKRLKAYTVEDYGLLKLFISESAGIIVTPNILTESSNLLIQIDEPARSHIMDTFRALIGRLEEFYRPSREISMRQEFVRLGLSDTAILEVAKDGVVVLSADLPLCVAAETAGYETINFHRERGI